jgi:serine/threonine protein kinase
MPMPDPKEEAVFNAARGIEAPDARRAYVERACGGEPALQARVEALLCIYDDAQSFPPSPLEGLRALADSPIREGPGTLIGPYKLLEPIGEGGFGVVFLAEQTQPVRRQVALKVLKPGMDSRPIVARFEAERQALALMDHPHIARVFDGGETTSCRPYFVMELVRGIPISRYCDEHKLATRERLALFLSVCHAVQHAHQKGVIHRDLKPSNVLVASCDGQPVAKVIDFGVAKALGQRLTEQTLATGQGGLVGTLESMSPEQAAFDAVDVDTRADIYSLGALLYELLTGTTPFDRERLRRVPFDEARRIIREEEPARPSARAGAAYSQRPGDPKPLSLLLRGELDWIVMKCLEKDRARRYVTANGLARDIERYLRDEPVEACPPSTFYRLLKFVRRNKGRVVAAGLVLLALVAGIAGTTWGMIRARHAQSAAAEWAQGEHRAKEETQKRRDQVEKATEILAAVFRGLDPQAADKDGVPLGEMLARRLEQAARQLEGEAVGDALVVARLQHVLGNSLRELGHLDQAEAILVQACRTRERLLGADHLDTAATKHDLAITYRALGLYRDHGKYAPAETLYQEARVVRTAQLGADHHDTLSTGHHLAVLYFSQGKYAAAETLYQEVLAARTARLGAEHADTLATQHWLALLYRSQFRFAQAEALYQKVLAIRTAKLGADHLDTVGAKGDLAVLYRDQRKFDQAEELLNEELSVRTAKQGPHHAETLTCRHQLAILYHFREEFDRAEALSKEVLALRTVRLGPDHPHTLASQDHLAGLYRDRGRLDLAEALYKEVLPHRVATLGPDHPHTLQSKVNLAGLYRAMKKLDQAIALLEEAVGPLKTSRGPDHADVLQAQAELAANYAEVGRFTDALPLLEGIYAKRRPEPEFVWIPDALLAAYKGAGKTAEAARLRRHLQAARGTPGAGQPKPMN